MFAAELRRVRADGGNRTQEYLAKQTGISRAMVSDWLSGKRFPDWQRTRAFLVACAPERENDQEWLRQWRSRWNVVWELSDTRQHSAAPVPTGWGGLPEVPLLEQTTTSGVDVTWYRDNPEFYSAAAERVRRAEHDIRVTYIRRHPPTLFTSPASADYFSAILHWAKECGDQQRSARRIIGAPTVEGALEPTMSAWLREHHADTADLLSYEAVVFEWPVSADGLNMALIDEEVAFLAFSGGSRQKLNGFSVANGAFVAYFIRYFEQLWSAARPLGEYLTTRPAQGDD